MQLERAMTSLAAPRVVEPAASLALSRDELIRAAVFWGFILLVIVAPAILATILLLRA